jgi:hypothetical protein
MWAAAHGSQTEGLMLFGGGPLPSVGAFCMIDAGSVSFMRKLTRSDIRCGVHPHGWTGSGRSSHHPH